VTKGEYLLEVRAEEIPARMLEPATRELATRVFEELMAKGVGPREIETGYTPRRLVLMLKGLPEKEADREEQVIGPPVAVALGEDGLPTKAAVGFAKRCGVEPEALERVQTDKGEYLAAQQKTVGRPTGEVLGELVPRVLMEIRWPKQMRWGQGTGPWVRPVHGVVSLLDGELVPFELFGVAAGRTTVGHPVLSPEPYEVSGVDHYRQELARRDVEVRPEERSRALAEAMAQRAEGLGGTVVEDAELLAKLASICEIPGVMEGGFDEAFLELPREVLIASLKDHQSAFTVEKDGELLPSFLTVMDRPDDPAGRVRSGNEWVVEARLADARFFFGEDAKRRLTERSELLSALTFEERLGSYADKQVRIASLSEVILKQLGWEDERAAAEEAALLLKTDLTTEMVKEFTSLQGIVGGIYARREGYPEEVWQALYDQYLPASADDPVPRGRVGQVVALADRLDTLVGIFGLGKIPTGSRDPFGLRRAAQGVVRIALEGEMPLDLDLVAAKGALLYEDRLDKSGEEILEVLRPFLYDRIRYLLGLQGYAYDEIEAGLAVGGSNLPDLKARVDALHKLREREDFLSVVLAAKRIVNIVKDAPEHSLKVEALSEPAEKDLHAAYERLRSEIEEAGASGDYEGGLAKIAEFAEVLDRFFVEVLVMDEDERLRHNRIALLQAIYRSISRIARLTEVVVDRSEHRGRTKES
jgi:glycyl-tRNA synthetase beta chain